MPVNLSIKEVPDATADRLRARAERNHRSLQGELMAIIERAANEMPQPDPAVALRSTAREQPRRGWKTVEDLVAERRAAGAPPFVAPAGVPLAVDIIRADRDCR